MGEIDFWTIVFDVLQVAFYAAGSVASAVILWFARNYQTHLAMLRHHEQRLKENDRELGELKVSKATMARSLEMAVVSSKRRDRSLHKRVDEANAEQHETAKELAEIKNDIKWICKHLKEKAGDDETES